MFIPSREGGSGVVVEEVPIAVAHDLEITSETEDGIFYGRGYHYNRAPQLHKHIPTGLELK